MTNTRQLPSPQNTPKNVPDSVDTSLAFNSSDPQTIEDALKNLIARMGYLRKFIADGKDADSAPLGSSTRPAKEQLLTCEENYNKLAYRLMYLSRDSQLLPLSDFSVINNAFSPQGLLKPQVVKMLESQVSDTARDFVTTLVRESGRAVSTLRDIMALEGGRGITKLSGPTEDQAIATIKSKIDSARQGRKLGRSVRITIKPDEWDLVKASGRLEKWQQAFLKSLGDNFVVLKPSEVAMANTERLREIDAQLAEFDRKIDEGTITDDDFYQYGELENERTKLSPKGK